MSGIVGIVHLDGAPVDAALLERLTHSLAWRGPDAQRAWTGGNVGFGHALLTATYESANEIQPCTLDGQVWITADARIDARRELGAKLAGKGRPARLDRPDAELILHAYHAWGIECLEHLLGDFAFAIWDAPARRLFMARDHFGLKPLFYVHRGGLLAFSNSLPCLRRHPQVSDELNELAIADFLLFDYPQDPDATSFADIRRLRAAHFLVAGEGGVNVERYWTLPVEEEIRYRRMGDYVEHFNEVLSQAVGDRLRTDRVSVFLSGGLDSGTVAAAAREILAASGKPFSMRGVTVVYEYLIPDHEREFVELVGQKLDIQVDYLAADNYELFQGLEAGLVTPEPQNWALPALSRDEWKLVAAHARVVLGGQGGDPALAPSQDYVRRLL